MAGEYDVIERHERVVRGQRLSLEHIECRTGDRAGLECVDKRGFVEDRAARRVDDHRCRSQQGELSRADQTSRLRCQGHVDRDDVSLWKRILEQTGSLCEEL